MTTELDKNRPEISVVIPVYYSEATLRTLTEQLAKTFTEIGTSWEIIFVDDGSQDGSWNILQELQAQHPDHVTAIQLMRNFGQHNALMCGFHEARGHVVITMDDDLQNPPAEIPKLLETLKAQDLDLVYGTYGEKKHAGWRNMGSRLIQKFYSHVFKTDIPPTSFRAIRSELMQSILTYRLNYTYIDGLLAWSTQSIGSVEVRHEPRQTGRSGYSLLKLLHLATNLFTNFSILPLQVVSLLGVFASTFGFLGALYYLFGYLVNSITVPGFATIVIAILVIGGLQMLALGIIGEYLGRLHLNMNRKPQFIVRQMKSNRAEAAILPSDMPVKRRISG